MKGLEWVALIAALVVGCSPSGRIREPEEAVAHVLEHCRQGEYEEALAYFLEGAEVWKRSPSVARSLLDRLCSNGQAVAYTVNERVERGRNMVLLNVTTFADTEKRSGLHTSNWRLGRRGRGWTVLEVR